jgi:hypothetical protein
VLHLSMAGLFCRIPAAPSCFGRSVRVEQCAGADCKPLTAEAENTCSERMNSYVSPEKRVPKISPSSATCHGRRRLARVGFSTENCSLGLIILCPQLSRPQHGWELSHRYSPHCRQLARRGLSRFDLNLLAGRVQLRNPETAHLPRPNRLGFWRTCSGSTLPLGVEHCAQRYHV